MFNTSQVIVRNQNQLQGSSVFVLNPPPDDLLSQLALRGPVLSWDYATFQRLCEYKLSQLYFAPELAKAATLQASGESEPKVRQALIFMPKSQAEFQLLWLNAVAQVEAGGSVLVVGEKREGVQTAAKRLEQQGYRLAKIDSARHCQLWKVEVERNREQPVFADFYQHHQVAFRGRQVSVFSLPGVFGVGRLDEGTALLLDHLGDVPAGRLLDFGCGSGVIGACLKLASPQAEVVMVDVHALALESTRKTLVENGLQAEVQPSDGLSHVQGRFQAIYTNPPFHTGIKTDYRVTTQMIQDARDRLEKGGELRLVANAFLQYPDLLQQVFGNCDTLAHTNKFKVLRAVRSS